MHLKISSAKWRPFCLSIIVLTYSIFIIKKNPLCDCWCPNTIRYMNICMYTDSPKHYRVKYSKLLNLETFITMTSKLCTFWWPSTIMHHGIFEGHQWNNTTHNAPVILSRFGRYVVSTVLTPTSRRNLCWFRLGSTLCHDVLRCCHAIATPEPRYCPVLTRLTSDTGKFSCVVLHYVSLPPRCSLAVATLSYAVPRIWRSIACHNVSKTLHNGACMPSTFLHVSATPQSRCTTSCYATITLAIRCCYVIVRCGKRNLVSNMSKIQVR